MKINYRDYFTNRYLSSESGRLDGRKRVESFLTAVIVALFIALPYYLFRGKLFIGGDDSRLLYILPRQFLEQVGLNPWLHLSSMGSFTPNYFLVPFLPVIWAAQLLVHNQTIVAYAFFSFPIILGFIYFRKLLHVLLDNKQSNDIAHTVAGLMYVLSPIVIVSQLSVSLYSVWLIGFLPLLLYYWVDYQKTGNKKDIVRCTLWSFPLALAFSSIPWLLGLLIPAGIGTLAFVGIQKKVSFISLRRFMLFGLVVVLAQAFWLIPFAASFNGGYAGNAVSSETGDTFSPTVLATAHGNIFYPLINLYHRQIAFDFNWSLKSIFLAFYDKIVYLDLLFLVILLAGIIMARKQLHKQERAYHLAILVAFIVSLFLFTVNIGPLKQVFLSMGRIPGFAMFRNFSDKFALGYALLYCALFAFSLIIISRYLGKRQRRIMLAGVLALVLLNAAPIRSLVVKPLWTTKNTQTLTTLPAEYLQFMRQVKAVVPKTTNIISLPLGESAYSIVSNPDSGGVYVGRSPVELLSGINDLSGSYSFPPAQANYVKTLIKERDYNRLRTFLRLRNVSNVIVTKNIPPEILTSYLFDSELIKAQDKQFVTAVTDGVVATSSKGNYVLYKAKSPGRLFDVSENMVSLPGVNSAKKLDTSFSQSELLSDVMSKDAAFVPNTLANRSTQLAYPLEIDKTLSLEPGKYSLNSTHVRIGTLNHDPKLNLLKINSGLDYQIGSKTYEQSQTPVSNVQNDALVSVDGVVMRPTDIHNYAVGDGDKVIVYDSSGKNILPAPPQMLKQWHIGDCNSYEHGKVATYAKVIPGKPADILQLSAGKKHNSCLYTTLPTVKKNAYVLSFDYQTTANKLFFSYGGVERKISDGHIAPGSWQHYEQIFMGDTSKNSKLYLYSGEDKLSATTNYKNLTLLPYQYSKAITVNMPVQPPIGIANPAGNSNIKLLASTTNETTKLGNPAEWDRGDCSAVDTSPNPVGYNFNHKSPEFSLRSQTGHNACINKYIDVNPNRAYVLQLDYLSNADKELALAVAMQDSSSTTDYKLINNTKGQWKNFRQEIVLPPHNTKFRIFVYSGLGINNGAETAYKNMKLTSYPLNYHGAYVLQNRPVDNLMLPAKIQTNQLNPITNHVFVKGGAKPFLLTFAESFHPGWKLYLRPLGQTEPCSVVSDYHPRSIPIPTVVPQKYVVTPGDTIYNIAAKNNLSMAQLRALNPAISPDSLRVGSSVALSAAPPPVAEPAPGGEVMECRSKSRLISREDLAFLRQPPVFDKDHIKVNGYANGWMVDPAFVRAHFGPEYYHDNADGSLDFNMAVYFQPQSYFYVGSAISGITLLGCIAYLIPWHRPHLSARRQSRVYRVPGRAIAKRNVRVGKWR